MEPITVTNIIATESHLAAIVENAIVKHMNQPEIKTIEPDNISGAKAAIKFLSYHGYEISMTEFSTMTAAGKIPCKRFLNRRLLYSRKGLLAWAESKCEPVGYSDAALALSKSANRKTKRNVKS